MAENLTDADAEELVDRIFRYLEDGQWPPKVRLGRIIDKIGLDEFKQAIDV